MNKINFHTLDAVQYGRIIGSNEHLNPYCEGFYNYPSTEVEVITPSVCPICNKVLAREFGPIMSVNNTRLLEEQNKKFNTISVYRCPDCNQMFSICCEHKKTKNDKINTKIIYMYPQNVLQVEFSNEIYNMSPSFVKIFKQSEEAEKSNLDMISGMGYRKALEFLIHDYLKFKNINYNENDQLSNLINKFIDNNRIKELAKKAAWLGNDQAHTVAKHQDRTVQDLKKFILAIVKFIEAEFAFEDANTII